LEELVALYTVDAFSVYLKGVSEMVNTLQSQETVSWFGSAFAFGRTCCILYTVDAFIYLTSGSQKWLMLYSTISGNCLAYRQCGSAFRRSCCITAEAVIPYLKGLSEMANAVQYNTTTLFIQSSVRSAFRRSGCIYCTADAFVPYLKMDLWNGSIISVEVHCEVNV
jgi:hypothetical protein